MAVKIGNLDISAFKVGSSSCSVYLGTTKLYPLVNYKFQATYSDSSTYNEECDGTTTLTTATTKPSGYVASAMTTAIVGDCITSLSNYIFNGFTSLTSCKIPYTVTSIGTNAFNECTSLSVVNIPTGVTTIDENTFRRCYSLSSITIPTGVTTIGNSAFVSCTGLTNVVIPSGVTSIGNQAFYYCSSLSSITVETTTPPTLGTNAFNNTNDCPIIVPIGYLDTYKNASGWSDYASRIQEIPYKLYATYSDDTTYLELCDGSTTLTTATTKPSGYNSREMTTAMVGNCITMLGENSFYDCVKLSSCTLTNSVTSIGRQAFCGCWQLRNLYIPSGVTSIGEYAFNSAGLSSITVEATTPPTLGGNAFRYTSCPIYVPSESVENYKTATNWSAYASRIQAIPNN